MSSTDQQLVELCRNGNREAFAELVDRYRTLVCSVAYSACGNFAVSEEIAQDVFVSTWKSLDQLRDPERLRAWLCSVTRNKAHSRSRRGDVLRGAQVLEHTQLTDQSAADPLESSIAQEELDLVSRTLQEMPATYREPLVLFYREEQSVSRVAELLDLSPDAVKQRLARGRRMLRDEVTAIVERGLKQSVPGRAFTFGVLAALPVFSGTAKAATITAGMKGANAMGTASTLGMFGAILGPVVGLLGGWIGYQAGLRSARSEEEKSFIKRMTVVLLGIIAIFGIVITLVISNIKTFGGDYLAVAVVGTSLTYTVMLFVMIWTCNQKIVQIRTETGTLDAVPDEFANQLPSMLTNAAPRSFQSELQLFGIPILAYESSGGIGFGDPRVTKSKPAIGWIAVGDKAYGIVLAVGGVAVAPVALGALAIGVVAMGGFGVGVLAFGGLCLGIGAVGGFAAGYLALGGCAAGWWGGMGGVAVAKHFAVGGLAQAAESNTDLARSTIEPHWFFELGHITMEPWFIVPFVAVCVAPFLVLQSRMNDLAR